MDGVERDEPSMEIEFQTPRTEQHSDSSLTIEEEADVSVTRKRSMVAKLNRKRPAVSVHKSERENSTLSTLLFYSTGC